jgi:hypothetical protein
VEEPEVEDDAAPLLVDRLVAVEEELLDVPPEVAELLVAVPPVEEEPAALAAAVVLEDEPPAKVLDEVEDRLTELFPEPADEEDLAPADAVDVDVDREEERAPVERPADEDPLDEKVVVVETEPDVPLEDPVDMEETEPEEEPAAVDSAEVELVAPVTVVLAEAELAAEEPAVEPMEDETPLAVVEVVALERADADELEVTGAAAEVVGAVPVELAWPWALSASCCEKKRSHPASTTAAAQQRAMRIRSALPPPLHLRCPRWPAQR